MRGRALRSSCSGVCFCPEEEETDSLLLSASSAAEIHKYTTGSQLTTLENIEMKENDTENIENIWKLYD